MSVFIREDVKNSESMSEYSCQSSGDSSLTNKILSISCLISPGSFASSYKLSISSATIQSNKSNSMLSSGCIPQQEFRGGTSVVDPKSPDFQLALPDSASKCFGNKGGWIQERLGRSLSGKSNRRGMEFRGTKTSYKCIENEVSKPSFARI